MNNKKTYPIREDFEIWTVDGNRKPGDRRIIFYFPKKDFQYVPFLKDLYYWMQLKGKVENNNYPPDAGKWGKYWLHSFVDAAIDGLEWEKARGIWKINDQT